ncbi:MAG: DinB family protein [Calditrichaeota bacterium]|nr:DinB family protein [Calditrichota bacterium]
MKTAIRLSITFFMIKILSAQGISQKQVLETWDRLTTMSVESVEKMPAEQFDFSPIEPLANFAKLVNHTTGANYLFAATVKLERPKVDNNATEKTDVIKNLKKSFAFIKGGIEKLSDNDLAEQIDWFGRKMSRLNAILTMTDHLQREHGKIITYLRLKKVAPAQSAGW